MFYKEKKRVFKSQLIEQAGGDKATKDSILEVLFDDTGDFYVYWWDNPWIVEKKWYHRLNYLWMLPLFWIFIAPFQWLVKGEVGFSEKTKVGEMILKLVGENK